MTQLTRHDQTRPEGAHLETPVAGLYATAPSSLPFAPSLEIRAFLLRRDRGNLLVYSAPAVAADARAIEERGGVSRQYLNHGHEATFGDDALGVPLFVHAGDRDAVARHRPVRASFRTRHTLDDDFEVIPTPGHTPGATAYLWDSGRHRFLFTGDTIYLDEGEWVAAVLGSSDRATYIESLELIRELDFDVLVPWAATGGRPYLAVTSAGEARRHVEAILARVRRGENR
jgi:glyoxylase-like metal-dependent hydrolase (beta-lactamase superfamily II)